jgi:hypothetical protein
MSISWQSLGVAATTLAFVTILVWKYRPRIFAESPLRSLPRLHPEVERARNEAQRAKGKVEKARALLGAAQAAARYEDHLTVAMGLYLRAMKLDPTSVEAVLGLRQLLEKTRPEMLEAVLWRRLRHLPWSGETRAAAKCAAEGLAALYRKNRRSRDREVALRKLAERI